MSLENIAFFLGALTAGGGTYGYINAGSVPSIAAGLTIGALYGLSGMRLRNRQPYGIELGVAASLVLAGSSLPRGIKTRKPLPLTLGVLGIFGLYNFGMAYRNRVA